MSRLPGKFYNQLLSEECFLRTDTIKLSDGSTCTLDPHQQDTILEAAVALAAGKSSFAIVHPGGSGKTVLEAVICQASQSAKQLLTRSDDEADAVIGMKDIVVAVERTLMQGIRDHLELALGKNVGVWGGGRKDLEPNVIVTTIQSLQRNKEGITKYLDPEQVSLIIGDEADKFLTPARRVLLNRFRNAIKIGLTATPEMGDGRHIEDLWEETVYEMKLKEGIRRGINVPPLFYMYEADIDGDSIKRADNDYQKASLAAAMKLVAIETAIPEIYSQLVPCDRRKDFPTLIYVPSVSTVQATTERLKQIFQGQGLNISSWTGDITTNRLNDEIDSYQRGRIDILTLCEMGGRGLNLPRARCIIDGYPTLSANKLEQRHSRGLRKVRSGTDLEKEGFQKDFALIAQIIPRSNSFRPITLLDVLNCWPDYRPGRVLGFQQRPGAGSGSGGGPPESKEVAEIVANIRANQPRALVKLMEQVDVFEALRRQTTMKDIPEADDEGFVYLSKK